MKLSIVNSGNFKLDGGAMFGVVPKSIWNRLNPADERNLCTWAMRCLLVEDGDRKILIDAGLGDKQDEKFMSFFEPHGKETIHSELADIHLSPDDITDVFITHLHFDHVGGALIKNQDGQIVPAFRNATFWSNKDHFDWAYTPNEREKSSFLKENFVPLRDQEVLKFVPTEEGFKLFENFSVSFSNGHTEAMMIPHIHLPNGNILVYGADLMPSSLHARKPYVMAYDIRPLVTLEERQVFYDFAVQENVYVFFEHDPVHAVGKLKMNERGRYYFDTAMSLDEICLPVE
ncbi:MAG: MBL fold metallo-hydrolase [Saprospiraceae bacterium]|nr:MBL fold metallo-hydrolase [Saprospiraceae bacterium]